MAQYHTQLCLHIVSLNANQPALWRSHRRRARDPWGRPTETLSCRHRLVHRAIQTGSAQIVLLQTAAHWRALTGLTWLGVPVVPSGAAPPILGGIVARRAQLNARRLQALVVCVSLVDHLQKETQMKSLCMAGGVALDGVANGRIFRESAFTDLFIHPAAGDSGAAVCGLVVDGLQKDRRQCSFCRGQPANSVNRTVLFWRFCQHEPPEPRRSPERSIAWSARFIAR